MTDETYSVFLASQVEKISCVIGYNYWFIFVIIKFVVYVTKRKAAKKWWKLHSEWKVVSTPFPQIIAR